MTEHDLLRDLLKLLRAELRPGVVFKHADSFTIGVPDVTVTKNGRTSWGEAKHATPKVVGTMLQHLTMLKLAEQGDAWYWVYHDNGEDKETFILKPNEINPDGTFRCPLERRCEGFDHGFILEFLRRLHT